MVRYTGRAKTQTGMNTNQVGLKMSGCPSRVGRKGTIIRKFNQRVNCMEGLCGGAKLNGKMWRTTYRNKEPFCKKRSTKCAQAAGGVGRINAPYFNRKVRAGESGCTPAAVAAAAGEVVVITGANLMMEDDEWDKFDSSVYSLPAGSTPSGVSVVRVLIKSIKSYSFFIIYFELIELVSPIGCSDQTGQCPAPPANFPHKSIKVDFNGYTKQLSFANDFKIYTDRIEDKNVWIAETRYDADFWGLVERKALVDTYPVGFNVPTYFQDRAKVTLTFT